LRAQHPVAPPVRLSDINRILYAPGCRDAARAVRDPRSARRARHGRGVQSARHSPRLHGRHQGAAPRTSLLGKICALDSNAKPAPFRRLHLRRDLGNTGQRIPLLMARVGHFGGLLRQGSRALRLRARVFRCRVLSPGISRFRALELNPVALSRDSRHVAANVERFRLDAHVR